MLKLNVASTTVLIGNCKKQRLLNWSQLRECFTSTWKDNSRASFWKDIQNQRDLLDQLGKDLGVKTLDDWYRVPRSIVFHKAPFISAYYTSLLAALRAVYPTHPWDYNKFVRATRYQWKDIKAQRQKLDAIKQQLGIQQLDDWYSVSRHKLHSLAPFIRKYYPSIEAALQSIYPQHPWDCSRFSKALNYNCIATQRKRLEEIGDKLGVNTLEDWYLVPKMVLYKEAPAIMAKYNSIFDAMKSIFPEHPWDHTKFTSTYWRDTLHQRKRLEDIAAELGVKQLDDWCCVSRKAIRRKAPFIARYYDSLLTALKTLYPHHPWDPTKFKSTQPPNIAEHRRALDRLGEELGVKTLDDWYAVSKKTVMKRAKFISLHYGNIYTALKTIYPQHPWQHSHFYPSYWNDVQVQRQKLDRIGEELGVQQYDDWYAVSKAEVRKRAPFIARYYDSMLSALKAIYPHHNWSEVHSIRIPWRRVEANIKDTISSFLHKYQIHSYTDWLQLDSDDFKLVKTYAERRFHSLSNMMRSLYPQLLPPHPHSHAELTLQVYTHSLLVLPYTPDSHSMHRRISSPTMHSHVVNCNDVQRMLQRVTRVETQVHINGYSLDFYLPEWNVAIEYQGAHHYKQQHLGSLAVRVKRDQEKQAALHAVGIRVVHIPYWWNYSWSQLHSTLKAAAPAFDGIYRTGVHEYCRTGQGSQGVSSEPSDVNIDGICKKARKAKSAE